MKSLRRVAFTVLIIAMASAGALSGQPADMVSDLELSVVVDAEAITPPTSTGRLTFTVTNHGPDQAGSVPGGFSVGVFADSLPFSAQYGALIQFFSVPGNTCTFTGLVPDPIPGNDPEILYIFWFDELPPRESAVCALDFRMNSFADLFAPDVAILNRWEVVIFRGRDPNPDNNDVTIIFRLLATLDIPTLSPIGLVILTFSILAAFLLHRRWLRPSTSHMTLNVSEEIRR